MDIRSNTTTEHLLDDLSKVMDTQWKVLNELYNLEEKDEVSDISINKLFKLVELQVESKKIIQSLFKYRKIN